MGFQDSLPEKGRGQKEENIIFSLCNQGFKAPKFIYEKKNMYFETRSARNTTSLLNPLNLFMGFPFCLLPPAFCLLNNPVKNTEYS
jgi:hypothetical protein